MVITQKARHRIGLALYGLTLLLAIIVFRYYVYPEMKQGLPVEYPSFTQSVNISVLLSLNNSND